MEEIWGSLKARDGKIVGDATQAQVDAINDDAMKTKVDPNQKPLTPKDVNVAAVAKREGAGLVANDKKVRDAFNRLPGCGRPRDSSVFGRRSMGAFNTLSVRFVCPNCGLREVFGVQFKFGSVYQLEYSVGDRILWGGNDVGSSRSRHVFVDACLETCPRCGFDASCFPCAVEIVEGIIRGVVANVDGAIVFEEDGGFCVVE